MRLWSAKESEREIEDSQSGFHPAEILWPQVNRVNLSKLKRTFFGHAANQHTYWGGKKQNKKRLSSKSICNARDFQTDIFGCLDSECLYLTCFPFFFKLICTRSYTPNFSKPVCATRNSNLQTIITTESYYFQPVLIDLCIMYKVTGVLCFFFFFLQHIHQTVITGAFYK